MVIKTGQMLKYSFDLGVQSNLMMLLFNIFKEKIYMYFYNICIYVGIYVYICNIYMLYI